MYDFEIITESSYNPNEHLLMVRFLDSTIIKLNITELPLIFTRKHLEYERSKIGEDRISLNIPDGKEITRLPAYEIWCSGQVIGKPKGVVR